MIRVHEVPDALQSTALRHTCYAHEIWLFFSLLFILNKRYGNVSGTYVSGKHCLFYLKCLFLLLLYFLFVSKWTMFEFLRDNPQQKGHFCSGMDKWLLGVFFIFELRPDSESLWKSASDEPIRFGDKAIFRPKKLTWNLSFWDLGFGQKTPWCGCDLAKRLLGADSALAPRSLLAKSPPSKLKF